MNMQSSFKQGKCSSNVATLLERVQFADPMSPDIDEDNQGESWGHYQFTAGNISPTSMLTTWQDIGSIATAFKLVAGALKICQDVREMCKKAGTPKTSVLGDIYLKQILERLKECWVSAGGVRIDFIFQFYFINHNTRPLLLQKLQRSLLHPPIVTRQHHVSRSKSSHPCPFLIIPPPPPHLPRETYLLSISCPLPFQSPCRSFRHQRYHNYPRCVGF
jgi:hypothetical protein